MKYITTYISIINNNFAIYKPSQSQKINILISQAYVLDDREKRVIYSSSSII